jgi:hypothetical protein
MKKLIFPIFAALILFSCAKDELKINKEAQATVTYKSDINQADLLPEAVEYYTNIAEMAKYYAKHQNVLAQNRVKSESGDSSVNTLIAKLDEIQIIDSANVKRSFFDLSEAKRDSFLSAFITIESNKISEKLKFDTTQQAITSFNESNIAVKVAFAKIKTASGFSEDPYWKVRNVMKTRENARVALMTKEMTKSRVQKVQQGPMRLPDNYIFWDKVISSKLLSFSMLSIMPNSLTPETFINRIRGSIVPGRLLIALPGGFNLVDPIVFYVATMDYDVGHVAVMTGNAPTSGYADATFTISTNSKDNMHPEKLAKDWCSEHGVSFVGQVFDYKWVYYYRNWHNWGFSYNQVDINNAGMAEKVNSLLGTPYVNWWEIPVAKWVAPDRLMCSTTAWWCAKQVAGVNIGDWYKPTILPAGVYLSDRVRIIDNTIW